MNPHNNNTSLRPSSPFPPCPFEHKHKYNNTLFSDLQPSHVAS